MSSAGETDTNTASKPAPVFGVTISNTANKNNSNGNGSAFGGFVSSSLTSGAGGGGGSGGNGMTTTTTSVFGSSAAPKVVPITPLSDTTPRKPSVFGDTASVWLPQTPPPEKKQPQAASTASATTTSVFGGKGGVAAPAARPFGSGVFGVTPSSSMSTTQQQQQKESDTTTTKAKPVVTSTDILSMSAIPAKASVAAAVADVSAVAGTAPPPPTSSVSSTTLFKSDIFNKDDSTKAFVKASISGTSSRTGFAVASSSSSSSFMGGGVKPGSTVSSSRAQSQQQERDFSSSSSPREKDDDNVDHEEAAVVASSSVLHPIAIFNESVLTRMHQLQQLTTAADELLAWNEVTTLRRETLDDLEAIALQAERELDECEAALNAVEKLDANLFRTASQTKSNTRGQQHLLLPQASMSSSGAQGRMWREYRDAFAVAFKKHNGRYEELSKRSKTLRALQQE